MFERFTDRARRVVVLAQEEAKNLNHNYIGTEHVLLGLISEGEGVAAQTLDSLGVTRENVREQVQDIIGMGQQQPTGHIPFTPRAKKVLELSLREALQLGHNYIGTEHILLGLIREGDGVAAQVLGKLGCDLNRVRQQVIQILSGYQGKSTLALELEQARALSAEDEGSLVTVQIKRQPDGRKAVVTLVPENPLEAIEILEVSVKFTGSNDDDPVLTHVVAWPKAKKPDVDEGKPDPDVPIGPASEDADSAPSAEEVARVVDPSAGLIAAEGPDVEVPTTVRKPRTRTHNGEEEATGKKD